MKQYTALMETEGVRITFTPDSIEEIARVACELNQEMENIGARRLHTIMEKVLEEISFNLPDVDTKEIIIDRGYVRNKILKIVKNKDLSKYIL